MEEYENSTTKRHGGVRAPFVEDLLRELVGRKIRQSWRRILAIPCQAVDT